MFRANRINIPLYKQLRCSTSVSRLITGKAIQKAKDISKNCLHGNWWENEYMPIVVVTGIGMGTCIGSYHGYQESKKYTYSECMFTTVCFGWVGGGVGYVLTMFFPVTIPIITVATITRQFEPVIEPKNNLERKAES